MRGRPHSLRKHGTVDASGSCTFARPRGWIYDTLLKDLL